MLPVRRFGSVPYIIAHRGASAHEPENTLSAFQKAADLGADLIECDVHLSRDGQLIVLHDDTLDRTTNGFGLVRELTVAEIKRFDAGNGERVPTLDETLEWLSGQPHMGIAIEIKSDASQIESVAALLAATLVNYDVLDRSVVISFQHAFVHKLKMARQDLAIGVLYSAQLPDPVGTALSVGAEVILPHVDLVTPDLVKASHESALGVFTWTVNDEKTLHRALAAGVDGIGTDRPGRLREFLSHESPELRRYRAANVA